MQQNTEGQFKSKFHFKFPRGPFKYYVSKEVGGWGQKIAIFVDLLMSLWINVDLPL